MYVANKLGVLAYSNGFTLWHYRDDETLETVKDTGFFNGAANMLRVGDMIIAQVKDGTSLIVVSQNDGAAITVSKLI